MREDRDSGVLEYSFLIENTYKFIESAHDDCEKKHTLIDDIKKLNDKVNKLTKISKEGINNSKKLLKSYETRNDNTRLLIEKFINNMYMQISAGHKESSANIINDTHTRDINIDELLYYHILNYANKINNMQKCISKNQKNIASTLSAIYHDDIDTKLNKVKGINNKLNILLNGLAFYIFNKKIVKEQINLDAKVSINIKKIYTNSW